MPNETIIPAAILTAVVSLLKAYRPARTEQRLETVRQNADAASVRTLPANGISGEVR